VTAYLPKRLLVDVTTRSLIDLDKLNGASPHPVELVTESDVIRANRWATSPDVTAFVVDDSVGEPAAVELFGRLRQDGNGIPFVYVSRKPAVLSCFGAFLPDLLLHPPINYKVLVARLDELLGATEFSPVMVDVATKRIVATMARAFVPNAEVHLIRYRACRRPVHEVNATIPLCGEAISGHLSVSASPEMLRRMYDRMVPRKSPPSDRMLEDLVGEISNQLLGGLKRVLATGGIDFALGMPMMYTGSSCPFRYQSRRGSLLLYIRGDDPADQIAVDLTLDSVRKGYEEPSEVDLRQTGELSFL